MKSIKIGSFTIIWTNFHSSMEIREGSLMYRFGNRTKMLGSEQWHSSRTLPKLSDGRIWHLWPQESSSWRNKEGTHRGHWSVHSDLGVGWHFSADVATCVGHGVHGLHFLGELRAFCKARLFSSFPPSRCVLLCLVPPPSCSVSGVCRGVFNWILWNAFLTLIWLHYILFCYQTNLLSNKRSMLL